MPWLLEHRPAGREWEKMFPTKAEAVAELNKHLCADCIKGEILLHDAEAEGGLRREKFCEPPNPRSARDLLSTPCGCEYSLHEVK